MAKKLEIKDQHEYDSACQQLREAKARLTRASQNRVTGVGLSPLYNELRSTIQQLEAETSRYKAKYLTLR